MAASPRKEERPAGPSAVGALLDHAASRRNRLKAENVIDSKSLERDLCEKPVSTFSHRALATAEAIVGVTGN
ncbi:hypothetical protein B1812_21395 [Methylocystis bryophila]|uniref:Uncharacterized protein n=1 Tax=Methylocystis bryophila TaxID=655015 RepID=A0A1W6N055_9HYPH|nr:hypothetical protein B1812_21395 [Methylocystis bryophila]